MWGGVKYGQNISRNSSGKRLHRLGGVYEGTAICRRYSWAGNVRHGKESDGSRSGAEAQGNAVAIGGVSAIESDLPGSCLTMAQLLASGHEGLQLEMDTFRIARGGNDS